MTAVITGDNKVTAVITGDNKVTTVTPMCVLRRYILKIASWIQYESSVFRYYDDNDVVDDDDDTDNKGNYFMTYYILK